MRVSAAPGAGTQRGMDDVLELYLRDHLAGATAGLALAQRLAGNNAGTEYGEPLRRIAAEVAEDRAVLEAVMREVGAQPSRSRNLGGWIMERLARLKTNQRLWGYSPLSRIQELESLIIGVNGKRELWRSLERVSHSRDGLARFEFAALADRAEQQLELARGAAGAGRHGRVRRARRSHRLSQRRSSQAASSSSAT
jgi:hypothetical protein